MNTILQFFGGDPLIALLTAMLCFAIAAGAYCINAWLDRRAARRDAALRQKFNRIVQASEPRPWSAPAAKGFERQRKVS